LWGIILKEDNFKVVKKKFNKILGVALTVAMLASLFVFAAPVAADEGNMQWLAQPLPTVINNVLVAGSNVVEIAVASDGKTIYAINNAVAAGTPLLMNAASVAPNFHLYKSLDAGQTWTGIDLSAVVGAVAAPLGNVAVSPDNPNAVAVSTRELAGVTIDTVFASQDGGITWTALPVPTGAVAAMGILDLKVGPARANTFVGREYLVATADEAAGVGLGSLQILGETAAWKMVASGDSFVITPALAANSATVTVILGSVLLTPILATTINGVNAPAVITAAAPGVCVFPAAPADQVLVQALTNGTTGTWAQTVGLPTSGGVVDLDGDAVVTAPGPGPITLPDGIPVDFMACEFSPNFVGDRTVVAVGAGFPLAATSVYTINTQPVAPVVINAVQINAAVVGLGAVANGILAADIALPVDYDALAAGYDRVWASYASAAAGVNAGGVNRVDGPIASIELGLGGIPIRSIAYVGDANATTGGVLLAGYFNAVVTTTPSTPVRYTTTPAINFPTWTFSRKPPTGIGGQAYVRVSPNFAADKTVYCGTTSALAGESAFSVSTDAGVSFNQEALIDSTGVGVNTVVAVNGIALTPDAKTIFVATNDGAQLSLWKSATPVTPSSWSRIYCFTGVAGVLQINRAAWATNPEVYFAETPTLVSRFFVSVDGGATFTPRTAPVLAPAAILPGGISAESSKVLYVAIGTNVYKSILGGQSWSPAVPAYVGAPIVTVVAAGGGVVLVGGTGACSRSTDGGTSFVQLPTAGLPATGLICIPDENYATNKIVYAGDILGGVLTSVYRINADTGVVWDNILNPVATAIVGLGMSNGAFYAQSGGALGIQCDRTLGPLSSVGTITWRTMNIPAPAALVILRFDVAQNKVYVSTGLAADLWAYNDTLATVKTTITSPASGTLVAVDPVTGRAEVVAVVWNVMGSGTGLVNQYTMGIYEKAQGLSGAVFIAIQGPAANAFDLVVPTAPRCSIYPWAVAAVAPDIAYTFVAGREYGMVVRSADEVSNDTIDSLWSDPVTFTIEAATGVITPPYGGPILQAPQLGGTSVALRPAFAWAPMSGVIKWDFEISKSSATNADGTYTTPVKSLIGASALTTNSWSCDIDLLSGTPYVWHVQGTNATGGKTIWGIGSFTTAAAAVFTCPIDGLTFPTQAALEAHNAAAHAPVIPVTPLYVWVIVIIGAVLVITVIVLIVTTRRTP